MNGLQMKYFVLKPKGTSAHAKASRAAMRTYARAIKKENPEFAEELRSWADDEFQKAFDRPFNSAGEPEDE